MNPHARPNNDDAASSHITRAEYESLRSQVANLRFQVTEAHRRITVAFCTIVLLGVSTFIANVTNIFQ